MRPETELLAAFSEIVGRRNLIPPGPDQEPYLTDWRDRYHGKAMAVLKPGSAEEVAAIVRLCAAERVIVVPQGGNTGMCGAATPTAGDGRAVVVRLDRMNRIRDVNPIANTIIAEAGCILATIQEAAEAVDRLFPLSLGAEGSCQIGGNISTNAGGTAVLRYGTTRELVLGLEAVLPSGEMFHGLRSLRKDNTGYDLKQLLIGAEGTLGIVTAAVLKLFARTRSSALALVALPAVEQVLELLGLLRGAVGDRLGSLEIMSRAQIEVITENVPDVSIPFALESPWYLLIELTDTLPDVDLQTPLEEVLAGAYERGLLADAIVAASKAQAEGLWRIRHSVSEAGKRAGYVVSHDSVVPLEQEPAFLTSVERRIGQVCPEARVVMHGHIGDGNIHVLAILDRAAVADPARRAEIVQRINEAVDDETRACGGAISAEHGIGLSNRQRLARVTDPAELALMVSVKRLLDPCGIMNPDKIFVPNE